MIYLDYQATTPLAPEARAAMLPWLDADALGNPHSSHREGRRAAATVEVARDQVTALIQGRSSRMETRGALTTPKLAPIVSIRDERVSDHVSQSGRLVFTSGATEAANLAIKGVAATALPARHHLVTIATEHACVLDCCDWLERQGWRLTRLAVGADGLVDLDQVAAAIDGSTALVCAMLVNNEIGVVQPIAELGKLARAAGALLFCDAVQGAGRVPLPLDACDLVAVSAHKLFGPKGIGALWVRDGVKLEPLIHGGGQEGGLRSGTLSPASCAGFGAAAAVVAARMQEEEQHVAALWEMAQPMLAEGWVLNGAASPRWRGNLNMRRDGVDAARLISELRDIAFSAGSACASGSGRPSHVLRAIGLSDAEARSSIRLGFGRGTDPTAFARALDAIDAAADRQLRFAA